MLKVFLVEDEFVMREGIKNNIDWKANGYEFCGEASDGEEAVYFVEEFFKDLGSNVMKSNLFRQYITMDAYFCVVDFVEGLPFDRSEIEYPDLASGVMQSRESAMEYIIKIMEKALELREKSASSKYGNIVDEVVRYIGFRIRVSE